MPPLTMAARPPRNHRAPSRTPTTAQPFTSRLPLPITPTTPLPPPRYITIKPSSLPVSRILFPPHPLPPKWREHPGLSRIPRLAPAPETPTPPSRKRGRGRQAASASSARGGRQAEAEVGVKRWPPPVVELEALSLREEAMGHVQETEETVEEGVVAGGEGGKEGGFKRFVKRIRRSFSRVTLKRRE